MGLSALNTEMTIHPDSGDPATIASLCPGQVTTSIDIGREEIIHRLSDDWQKLCDGASSPPFYWPQWIASYIRVFEPNSQVVLITARVASELAAVLPLIRRRTWFAGLPVVRLKGAANVHSVRFDIIRAAGSAGDAAIPAIWRLLKHTPGWQVIELPTFPAEGVCQTLLECAAADGFRTLVSYSHDGPILRMQPDGAGRLTWLAGTNRHFRHELRRYARLFHAHLGGSPELVRRARPEPDPLRRFYALEAAGWKGKNGTAIDCGSKTRSFYDLVAREASARGRFCLHFLECNGRVTAAAFSVTTDQCYFPLKIAYDETLHRCGPGHLLFNAILEECAGKAIPELYFGGNADRFKTAWTPETLPHYKGLIFHPDFRAQIEYHVRSNLLSSIGKFRRQCHI